MSTHLLRTACVLFAALAACGKKGSAINLPPPPPSNLPALSHVVATVRTDNVTVTFDPVAGAKDYRIYPVQAAATSLPVKNVTYRCAGDREAPSLTLDASTFPPGGAILTWVNHDVRGYARTTAQATLGYVYTDAGAGRVPVYALGDPAPNADNPCFFARFDETRVKRYTTDAGEQQSLLSQGWRDFGIPFYAPAAGAAGAVQIYSGSLSDARLYFSEGPEKAARANANPAPAFLALSSAADGTMPLMRVFYTSQCGLGHDELVAGQARFDHATTQGNTPIPRLLWTGIKQPVTLAVEALDAGCPYQGFESPVSLPAMTVAGPGISIAHQPWLTLDQVRAADPNGNVYINGQHDGTQPNPILRSFVQVAPAPPESWDFHDPFDTDPGPFTEVPPTDLFETRRFKSAKYDIQVIDVESKTMFGWGVVQNELWVAYADSAGDRNGKFRMTPIQKATLGASNYLHATMEVDVVSTNRRYPQIIVSDQDAPLQMIAPLTDNLINGTSIIVQTFDNYPSRLDIEVCDHRTWDVNNQCPHFITDWGSDNSTANQPPVPLIGELYGVDRRVRFDVWASTKKVYAMLDGQPMACANLSVAPAAGPVTVTFGDVLYHSAADLEQPPQPYTFHLNHMRYETRRHFDELGFTSGEPAPQWDETKVPCASQTKP